MDHLKCTMAGWDAREWTTKKREPPKKEDEQISKKKETSERTNDYLVKEHRLNLFVRDLSLDLPKEGIILIYCSKCTFLLPWFQQS